MVEITAVDSMLRNGGSVEVRLKQSGMLLSVQTEEVKAGVTLTLLEVKALRKTLKWAVEEMKERGQ